MIPWKDMTEIGSWGIIDYADPVLTKDTSCQRVMGPIGLKGYSIGILFRIINLLKVAKGKGTLGEIEELSKLLNFFKAWINEHFLITAIPTPLTFKSTFF